MSTINQYRGYLLALAGVIWLTCLATPALAKTIKCDSVRALDGDTFEVCRGKKKYKVRLDEVDAPELSQPGGKEAKDWALQFLENKPIRARLGKKDFFRRYLGKVSASIDGRNVDLGQALVMNGHAWVYRKCRNSKHEQLMLAEQYAKQQKFGIWAVSDPVEPWVYRKAQKEAHKR